MEPARTQRDKARRPRKSRRGKRYRRDSYYNAIQRACGRAGIKPWSPNQLRHTRGTVVRRDFGLEASQCVLGHIKADVTEIYAERNFGLARDIMEQTG